MGSHRSFHMKGQITKYPCPWSSLSAAHPKLRIYTRKCRMGCCFPQKSPYLSGSFNCRCHRKMVENKKETFANSSWDGLNFFSSVLDGETLTSILQTVCSCMQTSWRGHCSMRILTADCSPNPRVPWTFGTISIEFPHPIETQKIHFLTKHRSGNGHLIPSLVCFLAPGKEMCESEYRPMADE